MTTTLTSRDIGIWAPGIIGIGLAGFLGLFALDSFVSHAGILKTIIAMTMGLAPALIVLVSVAIGWIALISGPLVLEAAFFLASWRLQVKRR